MEKRELAKNGAMTLVAASFSIVLDFSLKSIYRLFNASEINSTNIEELFVFIMGLLLLIVAIVIYKIIVKPKGNK